jgi:hypothetical protein
MWLIPKLFLRLFVDEKGNHKMFELIWYNLNGRKKLNVFQPYNNAACWKFINSFRVMTISISRIWKVNQMYQAGVLLGNKFDKLTN